MMNPKFKKDDQVIYFAGNWHYGIEYTWLDFAKTRYYLVNCWEDECEKCKELTKRTPTELHYEVIPEQYLLSYEDYCNHGANECEHETLEEWNACTITFEN